MLLVEKDFEQTTPTSVTNVNYSNKLEQSLGFSAKVEDVEVVVSDSPVRNTESPPRRSYSIVKPESLASQGDMRMSLIKQNSLKAIKNTKEPIKITWKNLTYEVTVQKPKTSDPKAPTSEKKLILENCSGYALPGQTLYIMGSSGAGKTSLMNALSDRIALGRGSSLTG